MPAHATSVKLDHSEKARLQALADSRKRSTHFLMREAITSYLAREEKRAAMLAEAVQSWNEYQDTGLHVTLDELEGWAERLDSDPDAPLPECHP